MQKVETSSTTVGTSEGRMTTSDKRDAAANVLVSELMFCIPQASFESAASSYCAVDEDVNEVASMAANSMDDFVQALRCRAFEIGDWIYEVAIEAVVESEAEDGPALDGKSETFAERFRRAVTQYGLHRVVTALARSFGMTQREMAQCAGVAPGTMYRHFESRVPTSRTLDRYSSALHTCFKRAKKSLKAQ